jgi:hypothetical protein
VRDSCARAGTSLPPTVTVARQRTLPASAFTVTGILLFSFSFWQIRAIVLLRCSLFFRQRDGQIKNRPLAVRCILLILRSYANYVETRVLLLKLLSDNPAQDK